MGVANLEDQSIIGHHFESVPLLFAEDGLTAANGDSVTFDSLMFPYKFAYALTYVEGTWTEIYIYFSLKDAWL